MKKIIFLLLCFVVTNGFSLGRVGDYLASGGVGITVGPSTFLLSPQLEYVYRDDLTISGLAQIGISDGVLFTGGGVARWLLGNHNYIKPTIEAGIGIALSSDILPKSFGVHLLGGIGADYFVSKDMSIGSMLRLNFAPPMKGFFVSWAILNARFVL